MQAYHVFQIEKNRNPVQVLLHPLHSSLVEIITNNKTRKIIELINNNQSISINDLKIIGIKGNKANEVMALIEKLGIANKKHKKL